MKLYGPGHVVAYNYIADFHDGINIETYGNPDGSTASGPDIGEGPKYPPHEYWDRPPVAMLFYNNTILSETPGNPQNNHWRNNLMLGQNSSLLIFSVTTNTNYTSSDYNGFRPNPGVAKSFQGDSPPANVVMDPLGPGTRPQLQNRQFATLQEYSQATGQDATASLSITIFPSRCRGSMRAILPACRNSTRLKTSTSASNQEPRPWIGAWCCHRHERIRRARA